MAQSTFSAELMRGGADLVILTLLREQPMYGYQVLVSLSERGNGQFLFKQGTLYPLLYRLEREGLIRANWTTPASGKKRKVYSLTADGRRAQQTRVDEWQRFTASVNAILRECKYE